MATTRPAPTGIYLPGVPGSPSDGGQPFGAGASGGTPIDPIYMPQSPVGSPSGGAPAAGASNGNFTVSSGGLGLNFNLGPNMNANANNAYQFLNQSAAQDQGFLGNTITGTQQWVSGFVSPITSGVATQQTANAQELPKLYASLGNMGDTFLNNMGALNLAALNSQTAISEASIQSSTASAQAAASSGGGCYITTAICREFDKPDDCEELRILRDFRDHYMMTDINRVKLVHEYYRTAPDLVKKIDAMDNAGAIYSQLKVMLDSAIRQIKRGDLDLALESYIKMVRFTQHITERKAA